MRIGVVTNPISRWGVPDDYGSFLAEGNEPFYVGVSGNHFTIHGVSSGTADFAGYYVMNGKKYVDSITVTVEE